MFGCNNVHSLLLIFYVISNEKKYSFKRTSFLSRAYVSLRVAVTSSNIASITSEFYQ